MAGTIWGAQKNWEQDSINHPHEADLLVLNSDKARNELGWRDKLNFVESVEWTVNWYKNVHNGNEPLGETLKNIRNFESR
jgi:CDP-glucose 4,6-dehydratase